MYKVYILFNQNKSLNKYLILQITNITDFFTNSKKFLTIVQKYKSQYENQDIDIIDDFIEKFKLNLINESKEKTISINYAIYSPLYCFYLYCHRYPHGKIHNYICEKILFFDSKNNKEISRDQLLDIAIGLMPLNCKLHINTKEEDLILLINNNFKDYVFYKQEYLTTEDYQFDMKLINTFKKNIEQTINLSIQSILVLN